MTLSDRDRRFLERRRERTHVGLFVLPLVLLGFVVLWGVLFVYWPLAINPFHAAVHYEGQTVERGTLTTYAITVTILLNVLLLAVSLAVCFAVLWAKSERRYLRLLARLVKLGESPPAEAVQAEAAKPK